MSDKSEVIRRQEAIKALIAKEALPDQKSLVALLKRHYAIETNQSVVSRDLRHLGVTKKDRMGQLVYELPTTDVTTEILKLAIVDISHNETTIVVSTRPGLAAFVGDYLDQKSHLEILGCLAGENVIFIVPASIKNIKQTYQALCEHLYFKK